MVALALTFSLTACQSSPLDPLVDALPATQGQLDALELSHQATVEGLEDGNLVQTGVGSVFWILALLGVYKARTRARRELRDEIARFDAAPFEDEAGNAVTEAEIVAAVRKS